MIKINNFTINASALDILKAVRTQSELNGDTYLKDIRDEEPAIMVTCPFHKNHNEGKPSCGVFSIPYKGFNVGDYHCFACNARGNISQLVAECLSISTADATKWLLDKFGGSAVSNYTLPKIIIDSSSSSLRESYLETDILNKFNYYHPYLEQRGISRKVIDKFSVGYNKYRDTVTFPVWDIVGNLKFITERSVKGKEFYIPRGADKPLYLLNYIVNENYPLMMITEAQIDALTAWTYGIPCCATMGAISDAQIKILNKVGIRNIIIAFDNDYYGNKFSEYLKNNIKNDILIYRMIFPKGKKDINDLSEEEFDNCLNKIGINWRINKENF